MRIAKWKLPYSGNQLPVLDALYAFINDQPQPNASKMENPGKDFSMWGDVECDRGELR